MSRQVWIIENCDGEIDGYFNLKDGRGRERSKEEVLKILNPTKADLLRWARDGDRLRLGTFEEYKAAQPAEEEIDHG